MKAVNIYCYGWFYVYYAPQIQKFILHTVSIVFSFYLHQKFNMLDMHRFDSANLSTLVFFTL